MRKWLKYIFLTLLLAGGVVLCAVRWQAWFGMPTEPKWTGDTLHYVFPHPVTDNGTQLTVLVLGDIHNRLTREDYNTLAERVPDVDFIVQTGDWLDRGQEYYYQLLMREWTTSELYGTPVIACPGNHEYSKGLHKTLSPVWQEAFGEQSNYVLDVQNIRFIVMDTNPLTHIVDLTRELTWLRTAMYSAEDKFIVVLMHHPVLSPCKGRFNPLIYASFRHALGEADLVLAGHDHSYMRHTPFVVLNTAGKPKPQHLGFEAEKTDTMPVYGVLSILPSEISHQPSAVRNKPSQMELRIFSLENGELIDSLYVKHD
ncbi:MAG: metallophosphoesterase [Paludibacteraceae bacterium]|nr:metallophosphoesterase [Paludibacteraceae bacterium]